MIFKRTILFTSRDTGAAFQLLPVVKYLQGNDSCKIHVVASPPALGIFQNERIPVIQFRGEIESEIDQNDHPFSSKDLYIQSLMEQAGGIYNELKPDVLITGQSAMGYGVDEIFMYLAKTGNKKIPTYTFLDFWGGGNAIGGAFADELFVVDEQAKELSNFVKKDNIHVVGSPRHQTKPNIDFARERDKYRSKNGIDGSCILVSFFAQTYKIEGYYENYTALVDVISAIKDFKLEFKIKVHPKGIGHVEELLAHAKKRGLSPEVLSCPKDNLNLHLASDVIFLCTSMTGMDHAYLSSYSNIPIGFIVYLSIGETIKRYKLRNYGFENNPLIENGIGYIAQSKESIKGFIECAGNNNLEKKYHLATQKLSRTNAVEKIVKLIVTK